jgi:cation-transporting P-type ATPase C
LLDRVEQALEARSPVEKRADELAGRLAWLGLGATLLTLLVSRNVGRAAAVQLVMSCPCATVLAASTAVSAALANAADSHVLIKGGRYLEAFKTVDCICLDKTGTVTGKAARIVSVETVSASTTEEELLALAASAELHNAHPLARAIVREARIRGLTLRYDLTEEVILGRGVKASSAELEVVIGNEQFLRQEGVPAATFPEAVKAFIEKGCSCVYVAWNKALRGFIVFSLELKPDVRQVLQSLRESGVSEIHLVSGDTAKAVTALSQDLGVDGVLAEALPEDKARYVERLRRAGHRVAMVGDGINDALALSKADVGVALGTAGVESALSVADIAVARDELDSLLFLRALSDRAMYIVDFNHWLAVSTNIVGAALAGTGRLSPAGAGILHLVHSSGILLNSSSLLKWKRKPA